jgi:hypothetical protein
MGTKVWEVVCDESSIGDGEYCGNSDSQLGSIKIFYHEASSGKDVPCAVLLDLGPGVIGAARASPLGDLFRSDNLVNQTRARKATGPWPTTQRLGKNYAFVVNSEPKKWARPSLRVCVEPELSRCAHTQFLPL